MKEIAEKTAIDEGERASRQDGFQESAFGPSSRYPAYVSLLASITRLPTDRRLERQISDMKKTDFFSAPPPQVMALLPCFCSSAIYAEGHAACRQQQ